MATESSSSRSQLPTWTRVGGQAAQIRIERRYFRRLAVGIAEIGEFEAVEHLSRKDRVVSRVAIRSTFLGKIQPRRQQHQRTGERQSRVRFTRASKASGIPIATLSRRVATLEKRVGVRLLERATRRLALTEPGRRYLERCERIVQEADIAHEILQEAAERQAGHLRVSMPVEFGLISIAPVIDEFARHYPEITIDAQLSPRPANFADENVDVSIRLGEIRDPSAIVRRLGNAARLLYASPAYLARRGCPTIRPTSANTTASCNPIWRSRPSGV
jgi:hypothetical protein